MPDEIQLPNWVMAKISAGPTFDLVLSSTAGSLKFVELKLYTYPLDNGELGADKEEWLEMVFAESQEEAHKLLVQHYITLLQKDAEDELVYANLQEIKAHPEYWSIYPIQKGVID